MCFPSSVKSTIGDARSKRAVERQGIGIFEDTDAKEVAEVDTDAAEDVDENVAVELDGVDGIEGEKSGPSSLPRSNSNSDSDEEDPYSDPESESESKMASSPKTESNSSPKRRNDILSVGEVTTTSGGHKWERTWLAGSSTAETSVCSWEVSVEIAGDSERAGSGPRVAIVEECSETGLGVEHSGSKPEATNAGSIRSEG